MADDDPETREFEDRRKHSLWERFETLELECRKGHRALRQATNELEAQADAIEKDLKALDVRVGDVAKAPVEATKIRFSTGVMVSTVAVTVTLVGGAYGLSNRVLNKIDAFAVEMSRQSADDKKEREGLAKLYDERNTRTVGAIEALTRQQKLLEYEMQRLREDVIKPKGSTR